MKVTYWYNGKIIESPTLELNINDPGLLYGATIFTTLRVYDNSLDSSLTNWQAHCDRLQFSLQTWGWQQPNWTLIRQGAQILLASYPIIRITIFPDGREWITGRFLPSDLLAKQTHGICCSLAAPELFRSLPLHKTGNYLSAWIAKNNSQTLEAQEAILVDVLGNWLETTTGNLWGWRDGCWWTPSLSLGILPGVVRSHLIDRLRQRQLLVQEEPWTGELVKGFEALAYTNSAVEIIPIHTVRQPAGSLQYNPYHSSFPQLREVFLS